MALTEKNSGDSVHDESDYNTINKNLEMTLKAWACNTDKVEIT